jgi:hypothetical protein
MRRKKRSLNGLAELYTVSRQNKDQGPKHCFGPYFLAILEDLSWPIVPVGDVIPMVSIFFASENVTHLYA